jgi:hypothetical protein
MGHEFTTTIVKWNDIRIGAVRSEIARGCCRRADRE